VKICHQGCVSLTDKVPNIDRATCSTCAQCVAVCAPKVFSWNHVMPVRLDGGRVPSAAQLEELFGVRHSIRHFTKAKIDRGLLAEIVAAGAYAPTEDFHLRVIVIDDEELIAQLDRTLVDLTIKIYRRYFKLRLIGTLARLTGFGHVYQRSEAKLRHVIERRQALLTLPAAFLFVVGDQRLPLSRDSAQHALANMTYAAWARGVGSCLSGNGPMYFDRDKTIRKRLGLAKRHTILGTLMLGYPAVKFNNKVAGRTLPIEWNGVGAPAAPAGSPLQFDT
jgi:nitroreductase